MIEQLKNEFLTLDLKARCCWSKHTRNGVTQAVGYFCQGIDLDPNYALAYAGVVDCYLRLATNYFPPTDALTKFAAAMRAQETDVMLPETQAAFEIRCAWDREIAKREQRRDDELKLDYSAVHQWRAAYLFALSLYNQNLIKTESAFDSVTSVSQGLASDLKLPGRVQSSLTPVEEVQVFCVIAREQIDAGIYDAPSPCWNAGGPWASGPNLMD